MKRVKILCIAAALCGLSNLTLSRDEEPVLVTPDDISWGPASPKLPPGARFAVLSGDPAKPGASYVFRAELPDGYHVPPHWHPMDENVTVIEGIFMLGFGERIGETAMRELRAGSYVTLPKQMPHYNVIRGKTVLQFHGVGPYDIVYVNAEDDPRVQRPR